MNIGEKKKFKKGGILEILNNSYDLAKDILESIKKCKNESEDIFEKILKNKISNIELNETKYYESIVDYDFSLTKVYVTYQNGKSGDIYLKMIKGGKIKESIFCFWSILYDEFLRDTHQEASRELQKAMITQIKSNDSTTKLLLTLSPDVKYCAEISLVQLKKFLKEKNMYERWCSSFEISDDDILFVGRKMY